MIGTTYAAVPRPGGGFYYNAGLAYVYDLSTGQLKHTIISDTPQSNRDFGTSVDILDGRIAVSSSQYVYLFDANTGTQLARLGPTPTGSLGGSVALTESALVVGASSDSTSGLYSGAAFTFDLETYTQISKFVPTDNAASDTFGSQVAVDGRYAIVSGARGAYVFDIMTGTELRKLTLPGSVSFPHRVGIQGSTAVLSNPALQLASSFDWPTGAPLRHYIPSDNTPNRQFGFSVMMDANSVVVGALGKVYQFELIPEPSSAALLLIGLLTAGRTLNPRKMERKVNRSTAQWRGALRFTPAASCRAASSTT